METHTALKISKESERRGYNSKIPMTGTAIKRKKLSDITNTVSSSSTDPQFQESSMRGGYVITKECVAQLMEENAAFLKAISEKNKIIELSGIELQKLRLAIEKYTEQIRLLAQANTQIQAELTMSKERNKTLQHELGCTALLLKFKNSELEEKENLIQVLSEKLRLEEIEQLKHVEFTKGDFSCLSSRKRPCRSKRSTTSIIQPKEQPCREQHNNISDEVFINETDRLDESNEMKSTEDDHYESNQVACCALRSNAVDDTMSHKLSKHGRGGKRLVETGTAIKQGEAKETCAKRKYSKRRSDMTPKDWKYENFFADSEFPADSVTSEPLNETELKGENVTRKSLRRRLKETEHETQYSEGNSTETMGTKTENCAPITESTVEVQSAQGGRASSFEEGQGVRRTSVGRPLRKAAEKISSYKEIPLNVKMRRG